MLSSLHIFGVWEFQNSLRVENLVQAYAEMPGWLPWTPMISPPQQ